jgi:hypothetical protein
MDSKNAAKVTELKFANNEISLIRKIPQINRRIGFCGTRIFWFLITCVDIKNAASANTTTHLIVVPFVPNK